jgi:hypothetical protein
MRAALRSVAFLLLCSPAFAGGPLYVTSSAQGTEGLPFTWDLGQGAVKYRVDGGPMATNAQGTIIVDHATGVTRVENMFASWQAVPTIAITFQDLGPIQPAGAFADGDVSTVAEFNAVSSSCDSGAQSPVIFDANGSILNALGLDPDIIGFAGPCAQPNGSHFVTAMIFMNGAFQDGSSANHELTQSQFDEAITHEIGHYIGLDHSQINVNALNGGGNCNADNRAGLPLMFPFAACPSRTSLGLPIIAPDDAAWASSLYPNASFATSYGYVEGLVLFSDGITQVQGINVIVRQVDNPGTTQDESRRVAFSAVSGLLFTTNPGQSLTGDNTSGSVFGARAANREGYYKIPVPPGQYTVEIESVDPIFTSGSSVGPLDPPIPMPGSAASLLASATVTAGQSTTVSFTLSGGPKRFDVFEDESLLCMPPLPYVKERLKVVA